MDKIEHRKKWMPAMYVAYFGILQEIANRHGYALCVHGSVVRDFDLVAVPFDDKISTHEEVMEEIKEMVGLKHGHIEGYKMVGLEAHGRMCYAVECGAGGYFDISFTPTMQQAIAQVRSERKRKLEVGKLLKQINKSEKHNNNADKKKR